jgi:TonB family protein
MQATAQRRPRALVRVLSIALLPAVWAACAPRGMAEMAYPAGPVTVAQEGAVTCPAIETNGNGSSAQAPTLTNEAAVIEALRGDNGVAGLLHAGTTARVDLRVLVDETGRAQRFEVLRPSGHAVLDSAVRRTVGSMRFAPATVAAQPVAACASLPLIVGAVDTQAAAPAPAWPGRPDR